MSASDLDDYRWLIGSDARRWLDELADRPRSIVAQTARLRRVLSPQRTHLVLEQLALRWRAAAKFAAGGRMFFTAVGLEQATDQWVAAYKATRFPAGLVADLCCGVGGDLLALAERGPARGVDRDPVVALFARANLQVLGEPAATAEVVEADVAEMAMADVAAWHIDPDRRPRGSRTSRAEFSEPGPAVVARLLAQQPAAAVKLAPAAVLDEPWWQEAEREWISRGGQCRQLVAWFGPLARNAGRRSATVLGTSGLPRTIVEQSSAPLQTASHVGRYVFEPDAAVLAAGLSDALAAEHGLARLTEGAAYLTGDCPLADSALAGFEVLEVLSFDMKRLKQAVRVRRWGRLEVKKRGVEADPAVIVRQLRARGDQAGVLLLAPGESGTLAILARRLASSKLGNADAED